MGTLVAVVWFMSESVPLAQSGKGIAVKKELG